MTMTLEMEFLRTNGINLFPVKGNNSLPLKINKAAIDLRVTSGNFVGDYIIKGLCI